MTISKWLKSKGKESFSKNGLRLRRSWSWLSRTKDRFKKTSFKEDSRLSPKEMKWLILWAKSRSRRLHHCSNLNKSNKKCLTWWSRTLWNLMRMNECIRKDTLTTTLIYKRECIITTTTCRKMSLWSRRS